MSTLREQIERLADHFDIGNEAFPVQGFVQAQAVSDYLRAALKFPDAAEAKVARVEAVLLKATGWEYEDDPNVVHVSHAIAADLRAALAADKDTA